MKTVQKIGRFEQKEDGSIWSGDQRVVGPAIDMDGAVFDDGIEDEESICKKELSEEALRDAADLMAILNSDLRDPE